MSDTPELTGGGNSQTVAAAEILNFVERIERLEEEKKGISDDIREVKAEAKSRGYNAKIITRVIKLRAMDPAKREEEDAMTELYLSALGML